MFLVALVAASPIPADGAQGAGRFNVVITLDAPAPGEEGGFCRTNSGAGGFGATLTVVCSTGVVVDVAPGDPAKPWSAMQGGAYRYLMHIRRADQWLGTVDAYSGIGTTTSWRVLHLANWDYLELTVGW